MAATFIFRAFQPDSWSANGWRQALSALPAMGPPQEIAGDAPVETMGMGIPVALSVLAAVALLLAFLRFRRGHAIACPACGSRRCAYVGQVGACRNGYRCHECGFLWEPDLSQFARSSPRLPDA